MEDNGTVLDTAVIGGGITGLYISYLLRRKKGPGHKIALFEATDRFGGRIETLEMDGFWAEYGPMRFERLAQPLLMDLIRELGLEIDYFPPYTPSIDPGSLFDLHKDEGRTQKETSAGTLFNTLELFSLGILRILQKSGGDLNNPRDPRHWDWWAGLDEGFYRQVRNELCFKGQPLHQSGLWNVLSDVLSHKAVKKIIDYGTFYHVVHHNPNAAEWINFWLKGLHPREELYGIKQGTESLITRLVYKLTSGSLSPVPLHLNHSLTSIYPEKDSRIGLKLITRQGNPVLLKTRHLVLATAQSSLKKLAAFFPRHIGELISSVIAVPLVKCFFVTKDPWWGSNTRPQARTSSVPARELHYYYKEEGKEKKGMVMVYGEDPYMNYWSPFVKNNYHMKAELNQEELLVDRYLKYLSPDPETRDPGIRSIQREAVTSYGIHDWSREPFEAGCHIWKPGLRSEKAIQELTGFSLSNSADALKNVHICGEAYSDFQGFIEGGLRTAHSVLDHID